MHVFYVDAVRSEEVLMKQNTTLSIEKGLLSKAKLMGEKENFGE